MTNAPNPNANENIHMIVTKPLEPNVAVVTRGGAAMGADQATQTEPVIQAQPQVRLAAQKKAPLDVQKKKNIFMDVRIDFVGTGKPST